jgi:hypothetical protein
MIAAPEEQLTEEMIVRIKALRPGEKNRLVRLLIEEDEDEMIDPEAHRQAWNEEIKRRLIAVRNGTMPCYSLEETMAFLDKVDRECAGHEI